MNNTIHNNMAYPDFNCSHKLRCKQCIYHSCASGAVSLWNIYCQYILVTGRRRPCPANSCTVFVKGKPKKTISHEFFTNNI